MPAIATEAFFASRAMQALEVLAFGPSTATRVADELQVHPRTARRLLNRMVYDGWLIRRDGPRPMYAPTLRIVALAAQFAQRAPLVRHGLELASELSLADGEAVHLAVPSYRSALRLIRVGSAITDVRAVRDLAPAHATAAGKLLLAHRGPWREAVLGARLEPVTEHTRIDAAALRDDLAEVQSGGYARERDEFRIGVQAVAVPVVDVGGDVIAALALSGPADRAETTVARVGELSSAATELATRVRREWS